ncbi:MAG: hypothetical protein AAGC93_10210, partial [Cyanobacteria bacterium P01_F01_bin.53]
MRVNSALLMGAVLCSSALTTSTAQANSIVRERALTGKGEGLPSAEFLLGIDELSPLRPALAKRSLLAQNIPRPLTGAGAISQATVSTEPVSTLPVSAALGSPAISPSVSDTHSPQFSGPATTANNRSTSIAERRSLEELLATAEQIVEEVESSPSTIQDNFQQEATFFTNSNTPSCQSDCITNGTTNTATETDVLAQSVPSLEEIQQIQQDLRNLNVPASVSRRRAYPGITISNPTGYGADRGQIFAGIGFQSRTRFSGGTIFGGGSRDGTVGVGFGIGDARESVGFQISYTAASFGGSRAPLSGGLNAKIHKQFGNGWAAAIGGEGIINFGRLPEDDDEIEFNDFEGTYYGSVTKVINLREDFNQPFSRLSLTGGVGSGRFRSVDQI